MHPVTDEERKRIVQLARKYLEKHQPSNYRLEVIEDAIEQDDDWYYVVVEPSRQEIRTYDYSERLVEAELDLQEHEKVKVLRVPALPA